MANIETQIFNKYKFVNELREELIEKLCSGEIDEDSINDAVGEECDRMNIYYSDSWKIASAFNVTDFELSDGTYAKNITELGFDLLFTYFFEEVSILQIMDEAQDRVNFRKKLKEYKDFI